jgi:hypothetical protein
VGDEAGDVGRVDRRRRQAEPADHLGGGAQAERRARAEVVLKRGGDVAVEEALPGVLCVRARAAGGRLVGVEVKASTVVAGADFKGLRYLADRVPKRFHRGVVLYTGNEMLPFGPKLHAVPVRALWRWDKQA